MSSTDGEITLPIEVVTSEKLSVMDIGTIMILMSLTSLTGEEKTYWSLEPDFKKCLKSLMDRNIVSYSSDDDGGLKLIINLEDIEWDTFEDKEGNTHYQYGLYNIAPKLIGDKIRWIVAYGNMEDYEILDSLSDAKNFVIEDMEVERRISYE